MTEAQYSLRPFLESSSEAVGSTVMQSQNPHTYHTEARGVTPLIQAGIRIADTEQ